MIVEYFSFRNLQKKLSTFDNMRSTKQVDLRQFSGNLVLPCWLCRAVE
jgi:hypothetical protein